MFVSCLIILYVLWPSLLKDFFKTIWCLVILEVKYTYSMTRLIFHNSTSMSYSDENLQSWTMKTPRKKYAFYLFQLGLAVFVYRNLKTMYRKKGVTRYYFIKVFGTHFFIDRVPVYQTLFTLGKVVSSSLMLDFSR